MTASQTESSSAPEAIEDQPDSGGPSRTVSLFGGTLSRPIGLTNGRAKSDDIPVWVSYRSLPPAVILVPGAIHIETRLPPLLRHPVGILAVDVETTLAR